MKIDKTKYTATLNRLVRDEQGQDLIEYALLVASIAVAIGATFPATIAPSVSSIFSKIISSFTASHNIGS
jgi:Flp pilus assembly pilin Flp